MNHRADLEFTLEYAIKDLSRIFTEKSLDLTARVAIAQNTINNLHTILGYGTASEPKSSGELGAFQAAMSGKKGTVLDVGAHNGEWVSLMRMHQPEHSYHSFEPDPLSFEQMRVNLEKMFGNHGIVLNNKAVGLENGTTTLYTHILGAANASLVQRDLSYLGTESDIEQTVEVVRIDTYCEQNGIEAIDFLKIDVEGTEMNVILSALSMIIQRRVKFIQFEYGSCNVDSRTFLKDFYQLLKDQYKFYRVHPEGLIPCYEYQECFDCFNLANYILELK